MKFRRVLFSIIRLCQCSGLCPIPVYGSNANSALGSKKFGFASLTAIIFSVHLFASVHYFSHSNYYIDWSLSAVLVYINFFVAFTIRLHAAAVLIESYAKRSIQWELLQKLDEIEAIFIDKLKLKTNDENLRGRCHRFIILWIVTLFLFAFLVFFGGVLWFEWFVFYRLVMTIAPFYTCTLFYAQLAVYLDMLKYNIETINGCLSKLENTPRAHWNRRQGQTMPSAHMHDICKQLIYLRLCYFKTWEASVLINQCVRWSLLLGINNDFVLYVTNWYWILYCLVNASFENWIAVIIYGMWIAINMSHFLLISSVCERISNQVS